MNVLDFDSVRKSKHLVYEVVSGSRSYSLDTPASDWDYKGVFIVPHDVFYGLDYPEQLQDETNDIVYYELGKLFRLLGKSNPNILEIIAVDNEFVKKRHDHIRSLDLSRILSKQCGETFGGYALSQIRKARGVRARINTPDDLKKKTPLDYCVVVSEKGAVPLQAYLQERNLNPANFMLTTIPDCHNLYRLHDGGRGIVNDDSPHQLNVHEESDFEAIAVVSFNRGQFSAYHKEYKGFWEWRANRMMNNLSTESEAYDCKNMMHTFRLLDTALGIAKDGELNVKSSERDFLMDVRNGRFELKKMVAMAEEKLEEVNQAFAQCALRNEPDAEYLHSRLVAIREEHYDSTS
jgi:hypothetical protein